MEALLNYYFYIGNIGIGLMILCRVYFYIYASKYYYCCNIIIDALSRCIYIEQNTFENLFIVLLVFLIIVGINERKKWRKN